ncbi:ribonuclease P protein component [Saccharospirillum salsuginis]|uniref:Ribonuclease P protein component n=1 Tax=Saccharospirillum salsuginis TaxID=418750 RepID=A0A918N7P7_9GAMM|nr:ribonuclease P protein component [Saccharospirillum salsuginis]GGX48146.1 ribonuclease P protein component [Saccharospirillum salsuginis]
MSANGHPRTHRLLTAGDFRSVFDQVEAKAAFPQCLLLARRSQTGQARLGFIISKKNVRTAVGRNRIKRIAREVFRLNYDTLPPIDIILLGRKGLDGLSNEELHKTFAKQFRKVSRRWLKEQEGSVEKSES